eukprot:CAMPEP_0206255184 /NCGR_PEP_ID=MMETSP0047_2-20121206/24106_1 /ASSEMBLY_ACC=CAM_ASM_000192 /TAXON_ID=195065 /ORGANISM="Chroomonas mesostigmatica_cf, Strain CCMP1168" /LENGTH=788 /DNA_ID=CAMNT_0053681555 /DNA_START=61 /DNA_END=2427 /DNA_ORIENTATION=-
MARRTASLVALLLVLAAPARSQTNMGAFECPCISAPLSTTIQQALTAAGMLTTYGQEGCKAYDQGAPQYGCNGPSPPSFCPRSWCYIDPATCVMDEAACAAAGGVVGGYVSPSCRDRSMALSPTIQNFSIYYSYTTCGNLNTFAPERFTDHLRGRNLIVAIDEVVPWTHLGELDPAFPEWMGWEGAIISTINSIANSFDPKLNVIIKNGWATNRSRALFSSSYTACVHDVAVGEFDLCLADFWVTTERMALNQFVTPFGTDLFYLIARKEAPPETFAEQMVKPFQPFSLELWVLVIGFLLFAAFVMVMTDSHNLDDYANERLGAKLAKSLYFSFSGYVAGGSQNAAASVPGRLATIGFGWFVLITLASYTANLATILVKRSSVNGGINSIQDALDQNLKICGPIAVQGQLEALYPQARWVWHVGTGDATRLMWSGECDCAVSYQQSIKRMKSGVNNIQDCANPNLTPEESQCLLDENGQPSRTRDCVFTQVGPLVMSIGLSFPVSETWLHAMSHGMLRELNTGAFEQARQQFEELIPASACPRVDPSAEFEETDSLPASSMYGTLLVSCIFMVVGLLLAAVEHFTGQTIQYLIRMGDEEDADHVAGIVDDIEEKIATPQLGRRRLMPSRSMRRQFSQGSSPTSRGFERMTSAASSRMGGSVGGDQKSDVEGHLGYAVGGEGMREEEIEGLVQRLRKDFRQMEHALNTLAHSGARGRSPDFAGSNGVSGGHNHQHDSDGHRAKLVLGPDEPVLQNGADEGPHEVHVPLVSFFPRASENGHGRNGHRLQI